MTTPSLPDDILAPIRAAFFQECEELLGDLESGLLSLQDGGRDPQVIDAVFRAAHSIKGGAGAFGLDALVEFSHTFESTLEAVRSGAVAIDETVLRLLLKAADVLADLVRGARDGQPEHAAPGEVAALLGAMATLAPDDDAADDFPDFQFIPAPVSLDEDEVLRRWTIRMRPHTSLYDRAGEPLLVLRDLAILGEIVVTLDEDALPPLGELDPEQAYLAWTVILTTDADEATIRDVFAFVEDDCAITVEPLNQGDEVGHPVEALHETTEVETPAEVRSSAVVKPGRTIRVDLERVDKLINLVGELVINQSMLMQRYGEARLGASLGMEQSLDQLEHLTRDLQEGVMAMRAQPVKAVFERMPRLVREVEAMTGKRVKLVVTGEDTEVDRTVIERLTDPLTHMVRNAIDHGVETPAGRLAAGKPETGLVRISAAHRGGRIVIEVSDDGRGIDRATVRQTALRRGLIAADALLTDDEIDNLIFVPGFSTSPQLSAVSGRGVGMDVVKSGVQDLGGRIGVTSRPGAGACFTLSLPLTLAVLDGMVVSVAGHSLIVPLTSLIESVRPRVEDIRQLGADLRLLTFRQQHVPVIDLGLHLGYRAQAIDPLRAVALVVEDDFGACAALLVDEILGQRQVVIKSLEANYRAVPGVAAATILGDGRVALILDVSAVIASETPIAADPLPWLATG